ncbi:MAG: SpoIIE family protein phosphatase [Candidatus Zixiibacteriota bacterium]
MNISDIEHFKNLLETRQQNLTEWLDSLSAKNGEDARRAQELLTDIKKALERVDNKTYGQCVVCHGEVEIHRLEVQPAAQVCLDCISDEEKEQLEEELFLASKIHRALLPQTVAEIDGFEVAVRSIAARNVGGDYYDFLPAIDGRSIKVVIADSMGKGLPAGLLMSNLQGALRILAETDKSPAELVRHLNRWLCHNVPVTKFISLACVELSLQQDDKTPMILANAGHCPLILVRADGTVERLNETGGVLGIHDKFVYEQKEFRLASGDLVVLFTDGASEAEDSDGEMFGEENIVKYAQAHRHDSFDNFIDNLLDEIKMFAGITELADDTTIIALRKKPL